MTSSVNCLMTSCQSNAKWPSVFVRNNFILSLSGHGKVQNLKIYFTLVRHLVFQLATPCIKLLFHETVSSLLYSRSTILCPQISRASFVYDVIMMSFYDVIVTSSFVYTLRLIIFDLSLNVL